jgi:hypothetical protein
VLVTVVSGAGLDFEVLGTVVGLDVVLVVDLLALANRSAYKSFGDQKVLVHVATAVSAGVPRSLYEHVAVGGDGAAALPVRVPGEGAASEACSRLGVLLRGVGGGAGGEAVGDVLLGQGLGVGGGLLRGLEASVEGGHAGRDQLLHAEGDGLVPVVSVGFGVGFVVAAGAGCGDGAGGAEVAFAGDGFGVQAAGGAAEDGGEFGGAFVGVDEVGAVGEAGGASVDLGEPEDVGGWADGQWRRRGRRGLRRSGSGCTRRRSGAGGRGDGRGRRLWSGRVVP